MYVNTENVTNFSSFGAEHILEEIKNLIGKKNIMANIYRIQACDSIMWRCFCIGFITFMPKCQSLQDYTILFFPS